MGKKWCFIDYENVGRLKGIDLNGYDKLIVFLGAKQSKLDFSGVYSKKPLDITVFQVKELGKNNLDFHLAYYLGRYDLEAPKKTAFYVISNDTGYSLLVKHIESLGRECKLVGVKRLTNKTKQSDIQQLADHIKVMPVRLRPKNEVSLCNYIGSTMRLNGDKKTPKILLKSLLSEGVVKIEKGVVQYF